MSVSFDHAKRAKDKFREIFEGDNRFATVGIDKHGNDFRVCVQVVNNRLIKDQLLSHIDGVVIHYSQTFRARSLQECSADPRNT